MYMNMSQLVARHELYRSPKIYIDQRKSMVSMWEGFINPSAVAFSMSENDSKKSPKRDSIKNVRQDMERMKEEIINAVSSKIEALSNKTDTPAVSTPSNEVSSSTSKMITETDVEVQEFAGVKCVWKRKTDSAHYKKTQELIPDENKPKVFVQFGKVITKNGGVQKMLEEIATKTGGSFNMYSKMTFPNGRYRTCPTLSYKGTEVPPSVAPLLEQYGVQIQGEA